MRILRIADIANSRTGGISRAMYNSGDPLAALGHDVEYLFSDQFAPSRRERLRRFSVPWQIPQLIDARLSQGKSYDVVEIHEPLGMWYARRRRSDRRQPPLVLFSHGLEARWRLTKLAYMKMKGIPISLKERYSSLTVVCQAMNALRHADRVLCLSTEDREFLIQHGVESSRIHMHFNGVDQRFLDAGERLSQNPSTRSGILFLGTWTTRKGIMDLVPAVNSLLRTDPELTFTIAGCGADIQTVLLDFPADVRPRVEVIPQITRDEDLISVYSRHAIFVLPSYYEGHPLVMIEAAAMGLPIVTTNICGMRDFIENGVNGMTVPVGGATDLENALASLTRNPEEARRLGESARQRAQNFTWQKSADNLLTAYQEAAAERLR